MRVIRNLACNPVKVMGSHGSTDEGKNRDILRVSAAMHHVVWTGLLVKHDHWAERHSICCNITTVQEAPFVEETWPGVGHSDLCKSWNTLNFPGPTRFTWRKSSQQFTAAFHPAQSLFMCPIVLSVYVYSPETRRTLKERQEVCRCN